MTFNAREQSIETGKPVMLAEFVIVTDAVDGTIVWRFAAADQDMPHGDHLYVGTPMSASENIDSGEVGKNDIRLEVPRSNPIAELWRVSPPSRTVGVVLKEIHVGAPEEEVAWMGHVANVGWPNSAKATITLQSGAVALEATGLRRVFQRPCTHVFGGPKCKKDLGEITHPATIEGIDGVQITAAGFAAAAQLAGGYIRWTTAGGLTEFRFITAHAGGVIRLMTPPTGLLVGSEVLAVEGCDHSPNRCAELGNILNHGGIPHFMKKNPFDGNPVF